MSVAVSFVLCVYLRWFVLVVLSVVWSFSGLFCVALGVVLCCMCAVNHRVPGFGGCSAFDFVTGAYRLHREYKTPLHRAATRAREGLSPQSGAPQFGRRARVCSAADCGHVE